jgi:hypothetical protein
LSTPIFVILTPTLLSSQFKVKFKIVLSYFQVATGLSFNFDMEFPKSYTQMMAR